MARRRAYASLAVLLTRKEAVQFATTIVLLGGKLDPPGWGGEPNVLDGERGEVRRLREGQSEALDKVSPSRARSVRKRVIRIR